MDFLLLQLRQNERVDRISDPGRFPHLARRRLHHRLERPIPLLSRRELVLRGSRGSDQRRGSIPGRAAIDPGFEERDLLVRQATAQGHLRLHPANQMPVQAAFGAIARNDRRPVRPTLQQAVFADQIQAAHFVGGLPVALHALRSENRRDVRTE